MPILFRYGFDLRRIIRLAALIGLTGAMYGATSATAQDKPRPPAAKTVTGGDYTDRTGATHVWRISDTHALLWEGRPYVPTGITFTPRSFSSEEASAWGADASALDSLKARGITDILIWPTQSLTALPPAALQRLIDYLEAGGFRYGLGFGPGITTPITGTIIKPADYRVADAANNSTVSWTTAHTDTALYAVVDTDHNNDIVQVGNLSGASGTVSSTLAIDPNAGRSVALLFPHKTLPADESSPGVWQGFDDYRDQLLRQLAAVKFGPGLRFFLDPLARRLSLNGEADYLVPDSPTALLEWEAFLSRRYGSVEDARAAWAMVDTDASSTYAQLARLIPLWSNGRGAPHLYDVITKKTLRVTDTRQSHWWQDFLEWRSDSLRYYLNAMANILKRQAADVPILVTWTQAGPMFINFGGESGFDGLAVMANAHGPDLMSRVAVPALGQAEQCGRTMWLAASEITGSSLMDGGAPFTGAAQFTDDIEQLKRAGIKAFFAHGLAAPPQTVTADAAPWPPESLEWLRAASVRNDPATVARYTPHLLYYPQNAPGPAHTGPIPGTADTLWAPAFYAGETLDWWPSCRGYTIRRPDLDETQTVLVSLSGKRDFHFSVPDSRIVKAFTPDGAAIPVRITSKTSVSFMMDTTPTLVLAGGQKLVPQEAAEDAIVQLTALILYGNAQRLIEQKPEEYTLEKARQAMKARDYETAYTFARASVDKLTVVLQPYIWIEGENWYLNTLGELASHTEASNGAYLRLSSRTPPSKYGYAVRYLFDVVTPGTYHVWIAGTPPGPGVSNVKWRLNSEREMKDPADPTAKGPLYLNDRFGWFRLGDVNLDRGNGQQLSLYVTDPASTGNYAFSVDAILMTPDVFTPNGSIRPAPFSGETLQRVLKSSRRGR